MKYEIKIRKPEAIDLSRDCRLPNININDEDYSMYKESLLNDLKNISSNINVKESNNTISVESRIEDKYEFWDSVKNCFPKGAQNIIFDGAKQIV